MNNLKTLSKQGKIDLIKRIQAGKIAVISGQIVEGGAVLIEKERKYFLNGHPVELEQFKSVPECTLIILPEKGIE